MAGIPGGASIWYTWTAPIDRDVTIDTASSDFDTLLGVYTGGAVDASTEVASKDDVKSGQTSLVRFPAAAGTVYRIRVDGFDGETGRVVLHLNELPRPPAPANDAFANSVPLSGRLVSRIGDTNAGSDARAAGVSSRRARSRRALGLVRVDGAGKREVTIDTASSGFDTLLGAYTRQNVAGSQGGREQRRRRRRRDELRHVRRVRRNGLSPPRRRLRGDSGAIACTSPGEGGPVDRVTAHAPAAQRMSGRASRSQRAHPAAR